MRSPQELGYRQPAEWEPHAACWVAWAHDAEEWAGQIEAARREFVAMCEAIAPTEKLEILVMPGEATGAARLALGHLLDQGLARFHAIPYGDIWLRDIAPIFVSNRTKHTKQLDQLEQLASTEPKKQTQLAALDFAWNGWGEKYLFKHDAQVAEAIASSLDLPIFKFPWILEGGAVEVDGQGTCLTTKQCLLNPNRNPHLPQSEIETRLKQALGVNKILWLDRGLKNDHTDGHIDTIARFVAPGQVMCMRSLGNTDPNQEVLDQIATRLKTFVDAQGRSLQVVEIPSPGKVLDRHGELMPASYLNFYIANDRVVVPTYGSEFDDLAVKAIAVHFPDRQVIGLSARAILSGGGAFHCITQPQPLI
ncbi:agmatine deiminase [Thalassoporum mexicanum PCC 7367]|uniref:agmatine deiminase family protein n=1 Tax=Thalassoporum mexicanum TaxID=3457544 RepID=UPI00029FDC42|nr:agmatine deiminase [Pseudanabaena sp. PCC 7367]